MLVHPAVMRYSIGLRRRWRFQSRAGIRPTAKAAAPSTAIKHRRGTAPQGRPQAAARAAADTPAPPRRGPRRCGIRPTRSPGSTGNGARAVTCTALADGSAAAAVAAAVAPCRRSHALHQQADAPVREQGSGRCTLPHRQDSVLPPSVSLSETCTVAPPMTPAETFAGSATSSSTCLAAAS